MPPGAVTKTSLILFSYQYVLETRHNLAVKKARSQEALRSVCRVRSAASPTSVDGKLTSVAGVPDSKYFAIKV